MSGSASRRAPDLARITRLRELFLDDQRGTGALDDYWRDKQDLLAYDAVLGARIGWKWDAALDECAARGFARATDDVVLDFGCGAGIAARRFAAHFGAKEVLCHDRSARARAFAVERMAAEAPTVRARALAEIGDLTPDVLLVSHVLGELDEAGMASLQTLIMRSGRVVIVEPGNRPTSRKLSILRDEVLAAGADDSPLRVVAPCPHQGACPSLAEARDWCHFFATPPPEVFTDGWWVRTTRALSIDVRSLPYSFLCLDRAPTAATTTETKTVRPLGRAQLTPHLARVATCTADGLATLEIHKRHQAQLWRALKKRPEQVRELLED